MLEPAEYASLDRLMTSIARKVATDDPEALAQLDTLSKRLDSLVIEAGRIMIGAAENGHHRTRDRYSSTQVGRALGVSGAAVRKRFRVVG